MESLLDFALEERYKRVEDLGDKVAGFETLIEWDQFRPIIGDLYTNTTEQCGRPNIDVIIMVKLLVLQSMFGLSDPELDRLANDRISFLKISRISLKDSGSFDNLVFSGMTHQARETRSDIAGTSSSRECYNTEDQKRYDPSCRIHHC